MTREQQTPTVEQIQAAAIVLWEKGNERLGVQRDREIIGMYIDEAEAALLAAFAVSAVPPEGDGERPMLDCDDDGTPLIPLNAKPAPWVGDCPVCGAPEGYPCNAAQEGRFRSFAHEDRVAPSQPVPPEPTEGEVERAARALYEDWTKDHKHLAPPFDGPWGESFRIEARIVLAAAHTTDPE